MPKGPRQLTNLSRVPRSTFEALRCCPALEVMLQVAQDGFRPVRRRPQSEIVAGLIEKYHRGLRQKLRRLQRTASTDAAAEIGFVLRDCQRTPKPKPPPPPADTAFDQFSIDTPELLAQRAARPLPEDQDDDE